ncbi:hypothetical protein AMK68_03470 [candidate division KD3-62 bacterium DG_56]|uniref:DUF4037 domain-containing protein n=1 Tax=candidate division KD3-62 bacterium DG_56 TaxID=1704032 RepID=A0A0S7XMZ8_9BACT|nr:MAG: hypothetical protein AMK68_03470 [candidate division KD3-62 bacterium DG_56]
MTNALRDTGVDPEALQRYIDEQIYTVPGTGRHREEFSILLTGSRAIGMAGPESDVDIDVVCPREVYDSVLRACYEAGIIKAQRSFLCVLQGDDWDRYYGEQMGRPHFSLTPLDRVEDQFREYEDVSLWIWTNAKIITDPGNQFGRIVDSFRGYPRDVLVTKAKYHWLQAAYASITLDPGHPRDEDLLAAAAAALTTVNELLRFFFVVEGKPFPYAKWLMPGARLTTLGKEFCSLLQRAVDLVTGKESAEDSVWQRRDGAMALLLSPGSPEACRLEEACQKAMLAAGVDPQWVEADYANIDELLSGDLGPAP